MPRPGPEATELELQRYNDYRGKQRLHEYNRAVAKATNLLNYCYMDYPAS